MNSVRAAANTVAAATILLDLISDLLQIMWVRARKGVPSHRLRSAPGATRLPSSRPPRAVSSQQRPSLAVGIGWRITVPLGARDVRPRKRHERQHLFGEKCDFAASLNRRRQAELTALAERLGASSRRMRVCDRRQLLLPVGKLDGRWPSLGTKWFRIIMAGFSYSPLGRAFGRRLSFGAALVHPGPGR